MTSKQAVSAQLEGSCSLPAPFMWKDNHNSKALCHWNLPRGLQKIPCGVAGPTSSNVTTLEPASSHLHPYSSHIHHRRTSFPPRTPAPSLTESFTNTSSASPTDPRNMTAVTGPVGEKGDVYYWPDNVIFSWELVEAEDIQWELLDAEEEKGPEEALKGEEKNVEREGEIKHTYPPRPGYELKRTRTTSLQLGELARQDEEELMRSEAGERMKLEIEALQRLQEEDEKFAQLHAEEVRLLEEERIRARRDAEEQAIKMEELAKIELEKHRRFQEEERKKLEMENLERLKRQQEENVVAKQQVVEVERLGEIACPARLDEEAQRKGAEEDRLRLESAEKEERMRLRKEEKRRKVMEKRERQAREIQAQA